MKEIMRLSLLLIREPNGQRRKELQDQLRVAERQSMTVTRVK